MRKPETINKWIDSWLKIFTVGKIKWELIFKTFVVVFLTLILTLVGIVSYKTATEFSPQNFRNMVQSELIENKERNDSLKLETFKKVDEIEDHLRDRSYTLLTTLDADRTTISTFHNGLHSSGGLDYRFCNIGFEKCALSRGIQPLAGRYKNNETSDYPMMSYMKKNTKLFIGTPKEIEKIDYNYALKLKAENVGKIALYYMLIDGISLGILTASWTEKYKDLAPDSTTLARTMIHMGEKVEPELELKFYLNFNK